MSTETSTKPTTGSLQTLKPLEVKQAEELAQYYHLPQSLMNMFAVQFGETVYWKEAFLLELGHRKGIARIEVDKPRQENGEWSTEARIYPRVTAAMIEAIAKLPEAERREVWTYLSAPVREWGRASTKNVKMSTMLEWLDCIAIKRAVSRALRLFCGIGQTSYEELPEVVVESKDLQEAKSRVIEEKNPKLSASSTDTDPSKPTISTSPGKPPASSEWRDTT